MEQFPVRINTYLRDKGFASRREADELIAAGKVQINGKRAEKGMLVQKDDVIHVRGHAEKQYQYLAFYKPIGMPTQAQPGERSVITDWQKKGLFPVGRLDKESEGLLILTNDRRLTARVLGVDADIEKEYVVRVREQLRAGIPAIFKKGMDTETLGKLLPADATLVDKHTIRIVLTEGKKHQIRVMLSELGYTVSALRRSRVGHITLGRMHPGETRPLTELESRRFFE